jgi:hypothetical protein
MGFVFRAAQEPGRMPPQGTANLVEQGGVGRSEGVDHTCVRGSDHALVAHDWRIADLARGHTP